MPSPIYLNKEKASLNIDWDCILDTKVVFPLLLTDLTENKFLETVTPLTPSYHEGYHNTFTKQPTKTSVKVVFSFNFEWSMGLVLLSVKDCTVL